MIELDLEHRRLTLFNFWNENETVFWKWMVKPTEAARSTQFDSFRFV